MQVYEARYEQVQPGDDQTIEIYLADVESEARELLIWHLVNETIVSWIIGVRSFIPTDVRVDSSQTFIEVNYQGGKSEYLPSGREPSVHVRGIVA